MNMHQTCPPGRIALGVEYDGSEFSGWQIQTSPRQRTVQEAVQQALSFVADQPITVSCAGRTDAGVHASGQVVHFDAPVSRPLKAWVRGCNTRLPGDVRIRWAHPVVDDFHARFSAHSRRYRYVILNSDLRPALLRNQLTSHPHPLDEGLMQVGARHLLGEHDFSAFRGSYCQSRTPMRNVTRLQVSRYGELIVVDIEANAFLLHMVRNIVGVLLEVGRGRQSADWVAQVLGSRDRTQAADTAPAAGLYLVSVGYEARFGLPSPPPGPIFLQPFLAP